MANAKRLTYLDSSAIVKLAVLEPESAALRRYLRRRQPYVTSAFARTEVARALMPLRPTVVRRGMDVLARVDLVRINDRILVAAGALVPTENRSLDSIHLATAQQLGAEVAKSSPTMSEWRRPHEHPDGSWRHRPDQYARRLDNGRGQDPSVKFDRQTDRQTQRKESLAGMLCGRS